MYIVYTMYIIQCICYIQCIYYYTFRPICQICKSDDQSENLFEVLVSFSKFSRHTVLPLTLLLFQLMVSTRGETSAKISCSSTLLQSERVSERVRVFVSSHRYTHVHMSLFFCWCHKLTCCHGGWYIHFLYFAVSLIYNNLFYLRTPKLRAFFEQFLHFKYRPF